MVGEKGTQPSRGRLIACAAFSAAFAVLGALNYWSVVGHMLDLDLLRREGIVVHGWVTDKRADDRDRILTRYIVAYDFWPDHEFDKPYQRAKRMVDMSKFREGMESDMRKLLESWPQVDAETRERYETSFREWREESKREREFYEALDRKPPRCPREDPYCIGGRCSGRTAVSRAEHDSLSAKEPVPVTLLAGERWLHTIGRVDSRRVWRVPLWRIEDLLFGLFILLAAFLCGAGAVAEWRRFRRAARHHEGTVQP